MGFPPFPMRSGKDGRVAPPLPLFLLLRCPLPTLLSTTRSRSDSCAVAHGVHSASGCRSWGAQGAERLASSGEGDGMPRQ